MRLKQCKFYDVVTELTHGGILMENGDVLCGHCGNIIHFDEFTDPTQYKLLEVYDSWMDLTETIIGD